MDFLGREFYVSDFSPYILNYRSNFENRFLAIEELDNFSFSQIILNQVSYALNDNDLCSLLQKLRNCLEVDGNLIVSFSEVDLGYGTIVKRFRDAFIKLRYSHIRKLMKSKTRKYGSVASGQGWGFHRSKKEMIDFSISVDFKVLHFCRFGGQSFLFLRK
jgi:hypothetical protein